MKTQILIVLALVLFCSAFQTAETRNTNSIPRKASLFTPNRGPTWQQIFDSFMEGLDLDSMIDNTTNCVHLTEDGYFDVSEAVGHFVQRGWTWENYLDFLGAIGNVTPITRTCFDVVVEARADLAEYVAAFDGFVDFAAQARNNIVNNMFRWVQLTTDLFTAIQNKRAREIAHHSGVIIRAFFDFVPKLDSDISSARAVMDLPDLRPVEELLRGFLEGSRVFASDNISNCLNETEFLVASLEDASREFQKGTDAGFRNGVFEVADIFERLMPLNKNCGNGGEDIIKTFFTIYKNFQSPLDIMANALRHVPEISAAGLGVWQDFKNKEWHGVGKEMGTIFYYIFAAK